MNKLDPARLDAMFPLALEDPEINAHLGMTISRGSLQRAVRESSAVIWDAASEALDAEESARSADVAAKKAVEANYDAALRKLISETPARPDQIAAVIADIESEDDKRVAVLDLKSLLPRPQTGGLRKLFEIIGGIFVIAFAASIIGTGIALLYYLFIGPGWTAFKAAPWLPNAGSLALVSLAGLTVFLLITFAWEREIKRRAKAPTLTLLDEVQTLIGQIAAQTTRMQAAVDEAAKRAEKELVSAMVRVLRRAVDAAQADDYSTILPDIIPRGLAEGYNVQSDLITPARARLERYLESMPNGSIGIAGSRGAGKSTLLHTFAAKQSIKRKNENGDVDELGVISVEVSAPVQYDARDFVLHLFSSMCVRVRKSFGDQDEFNTTEDATPDAARQWQPLLGDIASTFMKYTAAIAAILTIVAVTAAISISQADATSIKANVFANMGIKPVDLTLQALTWFAAALVLYLVKRHTERRSLLVRYPTKTQPGQTPDPILKAARENALVIRYQRSYGADWNIGASFAGLSAGVKQAQSLQEQRLTLPEIVARYREFVTLLAARDVVIVAIDELDKIAEDVKAQQFLNDIKALFGIPNCFYLITVSDNAMSSFARRGLPIRDAFDSALDEIVRVEHMDLADAQKLIAGRVIGLPIPYLAFCYCYSGGLPRDLIRACRDVFELADRPGREEPRELTSIGHDIFCEDLAGKVKGSMTAVSALRKGSIATATLDRLQSLQKAAEKQVVTLHNYSELRSLITATTDNDVRSLTMDLASYLYYGITVLDVLNAHSNDSKRWEAARLRQLFDDLAALRRYIGIESAAAATAITVLRTSENLPTPPGEVALPLPASHAAISDSSG